MIQSFKCAETQFLYEGRTVRGFVNRRAVAERKLLMLDTAASLSALRSAPGNRLEALQGHRAGQYSIRINDQWRICFRWDSGAHAVEIVDYH